MRWITVMALCLAVVSSARAEDWGVRRDPFDPGVVKRYKALLQRDPHDDGALRALLTMYKRYRTVALLESEFRAELARGEDWATLVVLARMPRSARTDTVDLWKRAVAAKPDDARALLALGDALTGVADAKAALDAYRRAATHAGTPKLTRAALLKVIGAARSANDHAAIDTAYGELIALAPKDGSLWLERGSAQLAAGKAAAALDSFVTAEGLLKTDHERRLTAMTNQGVALERLGKIDDALAQYERTLDKLPRGYFLAAEIVQRIIDAERRRGRLQQVTLRLEQRWPEKRRGHYEWDLLGDLYKEGKDDERALLAYQRAVAKAPTEIVTQRKLIAMLQKLRPAEALAQHEAAARIAPGDADLQLDLAKRYYPDQLPKALATLAKLSRRHARNVNVRRTIAALYDQWDETQLAITEYEAIVALEPHDIDHVITLGDAYYRADELAKAMAAWDRLADIGTAEAHFRHGEILNIHELWGEAVIAYGRAITRDGTNADAYYGRARAYDSLGRFAEAVDDARRSVALIGMASHADGQRNRYQLVRALGHWYESGSKDALRTAVARWRFAFQRGDNAAGYLLAAHHSRIASDQQHEVLVELYRRVPDDDSLGIAVARSFAQRKDFDAAHRQFAIVAERSPKRAKDIAKLVEQLEEDRVRYERDARWEEEGVSARSRYRLGGERPDIIGRHRRFGVRMNIGADVHNTSSAQLGLGLYRSHRIARGTAIIARLEWSQRDDQMEEVNAFALGATVATRVLDARKFELAAGVGPRFELRYGSDAASSSWDRAALGADLTLEVVPRALPATIGLRLHHALTDDTRGSTLLFELGFELR